MKDKKVVWVVLCIILVVLMFTACTKKQVVEPITESTEEAITEPTEEPMIDSEEAVEITPEVPEGWTCENDPAKDTILDMGKFGKYRTTCREAADNSNKRLYFSLYSDSRVAPFVHVNPKTQKGETLSFTMPHNGWLIMEEEAFWVREEDEWILAFENSVKITVDEIEWSVDPYSFLVFDSNYNVVIKQGSTVTLEAQRDFDFNIMYTLYRVSLEKNLPEASEDQRVESIFGDKWLCEDNIQYGHELSEKTEVSFGNYGSLRPLCNPETNRWFLSFYEEDSLLERGINNHSLQYNMEYGGALFFKMPYRGIITYNKALFSQSIGGFSENEEIALLTREKGDIVLLYMKSDPLTPRGIYIDFMN